MSERKDFTALEWGEKRLPRDEVTGAFLPVFVANGKEYYIKADHISPRRWTCFQQLSVEIESGKSIRQIGEWISEHIRLLNAYPRGKAEFTEISQHTTQFAEALQAFSSERYNSALYLCTVFAVTEGEDLTRWDVASATAKIDEWNNEGYSVDDFFSLAAVFTPHLYNVLKNITANILLSLRGEENSPSTGDGHSTAQEKAG